MELRSRGFKIHYEAIGDGPALLLLHGITISSRSWMEYGFFDAFCDEFRVIAPDLLGHGQSDKPHDPAAYDWDDQVSDVLAVLDREGIEEAYVWGYSAGTGIGARLVQRFPERVRAVIAGGIPTPPELVHADQTRDPLSEPPDPGIDALLAGDWATFWETAFAADDATRATAERSNDPKAVGAWLRGVTRSAAVSPLDFAKLASVATLIYEGTEEPNFELACLAAELLGARFVEVPGCGHVEAFRNCEAVAPVVRGFLADVEGQPA